MAKVKIEEVIDYLDTDIRRALKDTVDKCCPGNNADAHNLFREFKRAVSRKCSTWENVPDHYIEND